MKKEAVKIYNIYLAIRPGPEVIKLFSCSRVEHEIFSAHKC